MIDPMRDTPLRAARWAVVGLLLLPMLGCLARLPETGVPAPGLYKQPTDTKVNATRRTYVVHVPAGYDGSTEVPLVLMLHGAFSTGQATARDFELDALADREGFLLVLPDGVGINGQFQHWNAGHCCEWSMRNEIDDVGFVLGVLDEVLARFAVDRSRIYVAGYSNGGMMAHQFAAVHGDRVAAVAAVAATVGGRPGPDDPWKTIENPIRARPVLLIHGRDDESIAYEGGRGPGSRSKREVSSLARSAALWAENNACSEAPDETRERDGALLRQVWSECRGAADVVAITLEGWPHDWPGPPFTRKLDAEHPLAGYDAGEEIWRFFQQAQRKPEVD